MLVSFLERICPYVSFNISKGGGFSSPSVYLKFVSIVFRKVKIILLLGIRCLKWDFIVLKDLFSHFNKNT